MDRDPMVHSNYDKSDLLVRAEKRMRNGMWEEAKADLRQFYGSRGDLPYALGQLEERRECVDLYYEKIDEGLSPNEAYKALYDVIQPEVILWMKWNYQL